MSLNINDSLAEAGEYLKNDDIDKALTLYEGIVHTDKENVDALLGCGKAFHKKGDFKMALNYYYKVLQVDEDNQQARTSIELLNGIFNFYNKDMYNP